MKSLPYILGFLFILIFSSCSRGYKFGDLKSSIEDQAISLQPPPQTQSSYWTAEEGVDLYHFSTGSGSKQVLVIHGGPGFPTGVSWPALNNLGEEYTVHYYHQRGCGKSTRPIQDFTTGNWGKNMAHLMEKLSIKQHLADIERIRLILGVEKLILVGHSYGGFLAALFAAEFPQSVSQMILIAPASVLVMPTEKENNLYFRIKTHLEGQDRRDFELWEKDFFNYGRIWKRTENDLVDLNSGLNPYYVKSFIRWKNQQPNLEVLWGQTDKITEIEGMGGWIQPAMYLSLGRKYDHRSILGKIICPSTIFIGDSDFSTTVEAARLYAESIPNAKFVTLKDGGHFPQTDPEKFSPLLQQALK